MMLLRLPDEGFGIGLDCLGTAPAGGVSPERVRDGMHIGNEAARERAGLRVRGFEHLRIERVFFGREMCEQLAAELAENVADRIRVGGERGG